jgi:acetyl-CoA C-acetyltransferase
LTLDPRTPVIVGAGQVVRRDPPDDGAVEPAAMIVQALRLAADDSGAGENLLGRADSVRCVQVIGWHYPDLSSLIAADLCVHPRETVQTAKLGGDGPLALIGETAADIAAGRADVVLVGGAECGAHLRAAQLEGRLPAWRRQTDGLSPTRELGVERPALTEREIGVGLGPPAYMYALIETAIRARTGLAPRPHVQRIAQLWSRFADVAAENPFAWIARRHGVEEIAEPTPANRTVCAPYTKLLTANIQVNMAGGLVLASAGAARAAGIPTDRWVFVHAVAQAQEVWHVSERAELDASPAIRAAGRSVLEHCGVAIDDVAHVDLYSCFPSAVQVAADELGLSLDDDRAPPTVTGGLTFAGGPGNNYTSHALATLVGRLRSDRASFGLATAVGWYLTKHAIGVLSTAPPRAPFANLRAVPAPPCVRASRDDYTGSATVEAYAVPYGRDAKPEAAIVSAITSAGERVLLRDDDQDTVAELIETDPIGREIEIARRDEDVAIAAFLGP